MRMIDMNFNLHKDVVLKNGVEGLICGYCIYPEEKKMNYLIKSWTGEGKISGWYFKEEFTFKDE